VSAQSLAQMGVKVVAVSDVSGAIENKKGIDIDKLMAFARDNKNRIAGYPEAVPIEAEEVLSYGCDILVPAALENVITVDNAHQIRAKIVGEGANGPTTPEAAEIMFDNGITVLPDILCNAGGVTVSYFEWVQNRLGYYWDREDVANRLEKLMVKACGDVFAVADQYNCSLRLASYILAIKRVTEVLLIRGIYA
jgi:glutamate dehydrogenase/leucine dehydrogenase